MMRGFANPVFAWNRVIGIFGGSFDPPHAGHRVAVEGLFRNPGLQQVWIIPSGNPPWKSGATPAQNRLEMAQLAFSSLADVQVLPWEIELAGRIPNEATTTWKLLDLIQPRLQGAEIAWVIGADQLLGLERWDQFPSVLGRCHWVVLLRQGAEHAAELVHRKLKEFEAAGLIRQDVRSGDTWNVAERHSGGKSVRIGVFPTDAKEVSSTRIREEAARTGDVKEAIAKNWLSPSVAHYLKEKKLYGTRNHDF